jgi:hypothetical protein
MASRKKVVALVCMITIIVLVASFEVGEAIRLKVEKNCYNKIFKECMIHKGGFDQFHDHEIHCYIQATNQCEYSAGK